MAPLQQKNQQNKPKGSNQIVHRQRKKQAPHTSPSKKPHRPTRVSPPASNTMSSSRLRRDRPERRKKQGRRFPSPLPVFAEEECEECHPTDSSDSTLSSLGTAESGKATFLPSNNAAGQSPNRMSLHSDEFFQIGPDTNELFQLEDGNSNPIERRVSFDLSRLRSMSSDVSEMVRSSHTSPSMMTPVANNTSGTPSSKKLSTSTLSQPLYPSESALTTDLSFCSALDASMTSVASPISLVNTSASTNGSFAEEDVTVVIGKNEFLYGRTMLSYASPVLAKYLQSNNSLKFSKPVTEWLALVPFLQPRSVQSATLSPANLPSLLPWFDQLQLCVLVRECDNLLSSLSWPVGQRAHETNKQAPPQKKEDCRDEVSAACARFSSNQELKGLSDSLPLRKDIADILVLLQTTSLMQTALAKTRRRCLHILMTYLESFPQLFVHPGSSGKLEVLQSVAGLLQEKDARNVLWRTIISFLPTDLQVYNDQEVLVNNMLFPYLLREGIEKRLTKAQMSGETFWTGELNEKQSLIDDPLETFHNWWTAWNNPQAAAVIRDEIRPNAKQLNDKRKTEGVQDRSAWLLCIWQKMKEPEIFADRAPRVQPVKWDEQRTSTRRSRTFAC